MNKLKTVERVYAGKVRYPEAQDFGTPAPHTQPDDTEDRARRRPNLAKADALAEQIWNA